MSRHDAKLGALTYAARQPTPDALINSHMPMVRKLAWHVHGRVSSAIDIEDLLQIGMIALIEAARAYEDRGHAFATYASTRVRGAMIDALRRSATQGRAGMAKRRAIEATTQAHRARHGREPSDMELASALDTDLAGLQAMRAAAQAVRHESIDDLYSDHSMWFADDRENAEQALDRATLHTALAAHIRTLPEREAMVLQLYFVEELNLDEIGETLGVGAARVCQIKKAALDKLREALSG